MFQKNSEQQMKPLLVIEKWMYFLILLVTLLIYAQVADHQFIHFDDYAYIINNPHVNSGISVRNIIWAFTEVREANWHPVSWMSHMIDVELFGLYPVGHHLVNLFWHVVNALLLLFFLHRVSGQFWPSAIASLLFAVHPVHVESVAWVAERKDVLSAFFFLLTLLLYHKYTQRRQIKYYLLTFLSLGLGLMSKPMLVTLPFVMLLFDLWPLQRFFTKPGRVGARVIKQLCLEKIPFFVLIIASSFITFLVQQSDGAMDSGLVLSLSERLSNAAVSYVRYMGNAIYPTDLSLFYPHPGAWPVQDVLFCAVLLIAISCFVVYKIRISPYLFVGWFFFIGTLVPVIGIVQVGGQSMADRYTYIPYIGLFIIVAWVLQYFCFSIPRGKKLLVSLVAIVIALYSFSAWVYLSYWKNDIRLFKRVLIMNDQGYPNVLAQARTLGLRPKNSGLATFYNNLGISFAEISLYEQAEIHFLEAININEKEPTVYYNLALAYLDQNEYELATLWLEKAKRHGYKQQDNIKALSALIELAR